MQNVEKKACLDIYTTALFGKIILYSCHGQGGNQFLAFSKSGQIVTSEDLCIGISHTSVILVLCNEEDKKQLWDFNAEVFD